MHTLFGARGSDSAAAKAALAFCALTFPRVRAALWEAGSDMPALLRVNPLSQRPTLLLPDGSLMTESAAIRMHLGLQYPASIRPAACRRARRLHERRRCAAWPPIATAPSASATTLSVAPPWPHPAQDKVRQAARRQSHRYWEMFADGFSAKPCLGDKNADALDILANVVLRWSGTRAHMPQPRLAFAAWMQRASERPRLAEVFARHLEA